MKKEIEIVFINGDKIYLRDTGNTYIGETAHAFMSVINKNNISNQQFLASCNYGGNTISKLIKSIN